MTASLLSGEATKTQPLPSCPPLSSSGNLTTYTVCSGTANSSAIVRRKWHGAACAEARTGVYDEFVLVRCRTDQVVVTVLASPWHGIWGGGQLMVS